MTTQDTQKRFSKETENKILELKTHYPERRGALIPALFLVQKELGYLPLSAQEQLANVLELPPPNVREVVTFYPMFHEHPMGKNHILVCRTLSCAMRGGRTLVKKLEQKLNIHCGEVTQDGLFSLGTAECLGSCGTAPMMMVNEDYFENLDLKKVDEILQRIKLESLNKGEK